MLPGMMLEVVDQKAEGQTSEQTLNLTENFRQRLKSARSDNQVNKLYLEIATNCLPAELNQILRLTPIGRLPATVTHFAHGRVRKAWRALLRAPLFPGKRIVGLFVLKTERVLTLALYFRPLAPRVFPDWERVPIAGNTILNRSLGDSRDLLIVFPPKSGLLLTSTHAAFLQAVSGSGLDVLRVMPERNEKTPWIQVQGFLGGFDGFISALQSVIHDRGYATVHTLGFSFGAPMAFFAGLALQSNTITTVGLTKMPDALDSRHANLWERARREAVERPGQSSTRLSFVVGSKDARDVAVANAMASAFPGATVLTIHGASHNPLEKLAEVGALPLFFQGLGTGFAKLAESARGKRGFSVSLSGE